MRNASKNRKRCHEDGWRGDSHRNSKGSVALCGYLICHFRDTKGSGDILTITAEVAQGSHKGQHRQHPAPFLFMMNVVTDQLTGKYKAPEWSEARPKK